MPNLLDLPPEIRLNIYDHVLDGLSLYIGLKFFKSDDPTKGSGYYGYSAHLGTGLKPETRVMLSLPKTCRQIYNEFAAHSRTKLPVVLSQIAGYGEPCTHQEFLSTSPYYHQPDDAATHPLSLIHPEHRENLRHLTLTNRGYGNPQSSGHEGLIGHYSPRTKDLFDPTGHFMSVAEGWAAGFPSLRKLTLAPYVYPDAYTDFSEDELDEILDDFGQLRRLLKSKRGIPVFRRYVQKSIDTISALNFCNGSKGRVELDLDIPYCEFHASFKQRPTDEFTDLGHRPIDSLPHVLDNDLWWTDQVDEQGWYLSNELQLRDYVLTAKARKGPNGRGVVDIFYTGSWNWCHSRPEGDVRWMFLDLPGFQSRREVSPRQFIEEFGYEVPAWLPDEHRKTLNITYQPQPQEGIYLHHEILRRHSLIKVKWLEETGKAFPPRKLDYDLLEDIVSLDSDDEDDSDDGSEYDPDNDESDDDEGYDEVHLMYAKYTLFDLWAAGRHDRARELPVVRGEEILEYIMNNDPDP